jgi:Calponin homology (CH) domain
MNVDFVAAAPRLFVLLPTVLSSVKVFSKWTAMTLEHRGPLDLTEAFSDPTKFYDLATKLAKRQLPFKRPREMAKRPRMVTLQELNMVLQYFQKDGVHITCAGDDLERGKEKLIMGLIWTLILKYQIEDKKKVGGRW